MSGLAGRRLTREPHVPMYRRVQEALEREIESGKYLPGQRFPSEAALVRQFAASRITVGRALQELVRRGLVERVAGSGTFVRPNGAARATLALLVPRQGRTEIFEPVCRGIATAAGSKRMALLWGDAGDGGAEAAMRLCDEFIAQSVAGVFFAPLEETPDALPANAGIADRFDRARIPLVLLDRDYAPYPRRSGHDLVGIDNRRAGHLATEHLLASGARRVAFVGLAGGASTVDARLAGYRDAIRTAGAEECILRPAMLEHTGIVEAQRRTGADAFVCANDRTAGEWMRALLMAGYRVPQDVRIAGIDDVEYASLLPVSLTTVRQPCREIGEAAVEAMVALIADRARPAREILLECRLIVRESCGAAQTCADGQESCDRTGGGGIDQV